MDELEFYDADDLIQDIPDDDSYLIEDMLESQTVSILTGYAKCGKSALTLKMADAVSKGKPFLDKETTKANVLYMSLDTSKKEFKKRIKKMGIKANSNLHFYFKKPVFLGNEEPEDPSRNTIFKVVMRFENMFGKLDLVIIDLFNNIRSITPQNEYSNLKFRQDIEYLIKISEVLQVGFLCLHHDIKSGVHCGYKSASGGTGLTGTIDGSYLHLIREGIGSTAATLEIGGRTVPEDIIQLEFNKEKITYELAEDEDTKMDYNIAIIRNYITSKGSFDGTLSQLCQQTKLTISARSLGMLLKSHEAILADEDIIFQKDPGHSNGRVYHFQLIKEENNEQEE